MSRKETVRKYNSSEKGKATHLRYRRTKKGKSLSRRAKLKYYFNMANEDYNQLFQNQKGCCAMCEAHQSSLKKRLYIDHNHFTGKIRGLLCNACNLHLGIWESGKRKCKPESVQKFQRYLAGERYHDSK